MLYEGYTNRNPVWIIWFAMLIPDSDFVVETFWEEIFPTKIAPIIHGSFHNIFTLVVMAIFVGWLIQRSMRVSFRDASLCVALGFGAHMLEDALVNGVVYHFYAPFSDRGWYQGFILHPANDVIYANSVIASSNIVFIGTALLVLMILLRVMIEGTEWLEKYLVIPVAFINGIKYLFNRIYSIFPVPRVDKDE
jgi:membrane-bound metal-dependent hydrolase YbcI (DUF457 family)